MKFKVNEIFYSIEGEGIRSGMPCVFVRLYGCNLHCLYCDTRYSCEGNEYKEMSIEDIREKISGYKCKNVTVTGGEPLIQPNIRELITALAKDGYSVNVETNGTIEPPEKEAIYTVDFKTFSSGESDKMNLDAFKCLTEKDVIKFVVSSIDDLDQAKRFVCENKPRANVFVSAVYGKIDLQEIARYLKDNHLDGWRMQLQMHKFIWSPDKRGV